MQHPPHPLCSSPYFQTLAPSPSASLPTPHLPLFSSASPQHNRSHLVLSQGQVGFSWNGGLLFLNGPTPSPVSFCGEEYAVCLRTGVPFFILVLFSSFSLLGNPTIVSNLSPVGEVERWLAGGCQGFPVASSSVSAPGDWILNDCHPQYISSKSVSASN